MLSSFTRQNHIIVADADKEIMDIPSCVHLKAAQTDTQFDVRRLIVPDSDLLILDITAPERSYCIPCRQICNVPILSFTAKNGNSGLMPGCPSERGGCLIKPFVYPELFARRKILRCSAYQGRHTRKPGEKYFPSASNTVMVFIRKIRERNRECPQKPVILATVLERGDKIA